MKKLPLLIILLSFFAIVSVSAKAADKSDILFQYSTINALLNGLYEGDVSFSALSANGDFGLGTFNHLDGEMIALDGNFYQIKVDGLAYPVNPDQKTPFAVVAHFDTDQSAVLPSGLDYHELEQVLNKLIVNRNHFYAFRIQGLFAEITVRSVPAQSSPYRPLAIVIKDQAVFEHKDIKGTLVGFYTPDYMKGLNVPGYHFHFISHDRSCGGHVLAVNTASGQIFIDHINEISMKLPDSQDFARQNLAGDQDKELDKVEKK